MKGPEKSPEIPVCHLTGNPDIFCACKVINKHSLQDLSLSKKYQWYSW